MNVPNLLPSECLREIKEEKEINGKWYIARPMGMKGFFILKRLVLAFHVFTGEYDAIKWNNQ